MRVATYYVGCDWTIIENIPIPDAPLAISAVNCCGVDLWALSDPDATVPNRIIDGRVINGKFSLCHAGFHSLGVEFAQSIGENCTFEHAQHAVADGKEILA